VFEVIDEFGLDVRVQLTGPLVKHAESQPNAGDVMTPEAFFDLRPSTVQTSAGSLFSGSHMPEVMAVVESWVARLDEVIQLGPCRIRSTE
jgi:hypothetical protein